MRHSNVAKIPIEVVLKQKITDNDRMYATWTLYEWTCTYHVINTKVDWIVVSG